MKLYVCVKDCVKSFVFVWSSWLCKFVITPMEQNIKFDDQISDDDPLLK